MRNSLKLMIALGSVAVLSLVLWWQNRPLPTPAPAPEAVTAAVAPAVEAPAPEPAPVETAPAEAKPAAAPQFDVVRVTPEGQAVIAGHAVPGQEVEVVLDGSVIGKAVADAQGDFAAVLEILPSSEPRELLLRAKLSGDSADITEQVRGAISPKLAAARAAAEAKKAEAEKAEAAAAEAERMAAAKAEAARIAAEKAASARAAAEKAEADRKARQATAEPAGEDAAEAARLAQESDEAARVAAENAEAARLAAADAVTARTAATKAGAERDAAEADQAAAEQAADAAGQSATTGAATPGTEMRLGEVASSGPVIILPQLEAEKAPVLVKPEKDSVTLLQPAPVEPASGIALDRITYTEGGDLVAAGRGAANTLIRIYANSVLKAEVQLDAGGQWEAQIGAGIAQDTQLLRFDAVDGKGTVISRLETPFEYSPLASVQEVRERKIVVQRGDHLWKFAEQYYGAGLRYSVIFSANSELIRDPDLIYPGQVFTVPELVTSQ